MFRKMPFILIAIIVIAGLIHGSLPIAFKSQLFALSLTIKSVIIFLLPLLIFGLLFKTAVQLSQNATKMILFLLAAICVSNFASTMLSYGAGQIAYGLDLSLSFPKESDALLPTWQFALPKLIGNETAMFSGLILGIICGRWSPNVAKRVSNFLELAINVILKGFLCIIPFFILGFVIKMNHDQVMWHIVRNYALVFVLVALSVFSYITFLYLLANKFNLKHFAASIKNMLPAAIAGFGSMSSAAAMPLTIIGAEKNSRHPDIARSIIPATVNVHLIGDCFAIPIFAFAVLKNFSAPNPEFFNYLTFAFYFVIAKFSVAAVPGGGILVMLPILESALGFDPSMLSLITALYILFDPIITCANVMGNGGFAMILDRLVKGKASQPSQINRETTSPVV
jgi:Na+/H+-dicarboxylate symporter